jgi:hypothetical protein
MILIAEWLTSVASEDMDIPVFVNNLLKNAKYKQSKAFGLFETNNASTHDQLQKMLDFDVNDQNRISELRDGEGRFLDSSVAGWSSDCNSVFTCCESRIAYFDHSQRYSLNLNCSTKHDTGDHKFILRAPNGSTNSARFDHVFIAFHSAYLSAWNGLDFDCRDNHNEILSSESEIDDHRGYEEIRTMEQRLANLLGFFAAQQTERNVVR